MARGLRALLLLASISQSQAEKKPHVLFILADDYGWANMGVHRRGVPQSAAEKQAQAEVHTPVIDALIDNGILLDRHYTYKICSPSRSSLQTGRLAVHVNPVNSGVTSHNPADPVSGYAGIPRNMTALAEKMRQGGYRAHAVGKWDVGMATPEHSPKGRGYETWVGYYQHANEYWKKSTVWVATGEIDACLNHMADFSMHNETYSGGVRDKEALSGACEKDLEADPACYEEHIFKERVIEVIKNHDTSKVESPLFLFYSFHLVHTPLQVPNAWLEKIDYLAKKNGGGVFSSKNRRLYAAMVLYMDYAIGEAVRALKEKGMYEDTLIVFTSDNGGPIYEPGAANNHPLKGGKYADWEGGVRTNAFVSGGFVPKARRGSKFEGVVSIADWYGTFAELAGVDLRDEKAEKANAFLREKGLPLLHKVDSVPQWKHIVANKNARPGAFHLSEQAVMVWPYKLVTGKQVFSSWTGPLFPNCSTVKSMAENNGPAPANNDVKIFGEQMPIAPTPEEVYRQTWSRDCGDGCLVNVLTDPTEHVDLAHDPAYQEKLQSMQGILKELNKDLFKPDRGLGSVEACYTALDQGRIFGPFVDDDGFYSPPPPRTRLERLSDAILRKELQVVNSKSVKPLVVGAAQKLFPYVAEKLGGRVDQCIGPEDFDGDKRLSPEEPTAMFTV